MSLQNPAPSAPYRKTTEDSLPRSGPIHQGSVKEVDTTQDWVIGAIATLLLIFL